MPKACPPRFFLPGTKYLDGNIKKKKPLTNYSLQICGKLQIVAVDTIQENVGEYYKNQKNFSIDILSLFLHNYQEKTKFFSKVSNSSKLLKTRSHWSSALVLPNQQNIINQSQIKILTPIKPQQQKHKNTRPTPNNPKKVKKIVIYV